MDLEPAPLPPCPACAGPWLYCLTFQHSTSCPHYEADSATTMADYTKHQGVRPLTDTEKELIQDEYEIPEDPDSLAVRFRHYGIHIRHVVIQHTAGGGTRPAARRAAGPADA